MRETRRERRFSRKVTRVDGWGWGAFGGGEGGGVEKVGGVEGLKDDYLVVVGVVVGVGGVGVQE